MSTKIDLPNLMFYILQLSRDPEELRRIGEFCLDRADDLIEQIASERLAEMREEERALLHADDASRYHDAMASEPPERHKYEPTY